MVRLVFLCMLALLPTHATAQTWSMHPTTPYQYGGVWLTPPVGTTPTEASVGYWQPAVPQPVTVWQQPQTATIWQQPQTSWGSLPSGSLIANTWSQPSVPGQNLNQWSPQQNSQRQSPKLTVNRIAIGNQWYDVRLSVGGVPISFQDNGWGRGTTFCFGNWGC
jgi:hypothetical protein